MRLLIILFFVLYSGAASAWDGVDAETGEEVEIGKGNLVRSGQEIEIYDGETGENKTVTVESVTGSGNSVTVEVYDDEKGETRTFEMEKD